RVANAMTFVACAVDLFREVEEDGQRLRRVQVVVHRRCEALAKRREVDAGRAGAIAGWGARGGSQAGGALLGGVERVLAEGERLAVVRRQDPEAQAVAADLVKAIADGDEV